MKDEYKRRVELRNSLVRAGYSITGWARAHGWTRHDFNNAMRSDSSSETTNAIIKQLEEEFGE